MHVPWLSLGLFPSESQIQEAPAEARRERCLAFVGFYGSLVAVVVGILSLRWAWLKLNLPQRSSRALFSRSSRVLYSRLQPQQGACDPGENDAICIAEGGVDQEEEKEVLPEHGSFYHFADAMFLVFHLAYNFCLVQIMIFAVLNDGICNSLGMLWELYAPWLLEVLITHLVCAFPAEMQDSEHHRVLPVTLLTALLGDRFNILKDMQALAIYAKAGGAVGWLCFAVSTTAMVAAKGLIYGCRADLAQMRKDYWPPASNPDDEEDSLDVWIEKFAEKGREEFVSLQEALRATRMSAGWYGWRRRLIKFTFSSTTGYRQQIAKVEQIPQTFAGLFFSANNHHASGFVFFSTLLTMAQALLVTCLRPYAVCWMARGGRPLRNVSVQDLTRAYACFAWRPLHGRVAAAELLVCHSVPRSVRLQAASIFCQDDEASDDACALTPSVLGRLIDLRWEPEFRRVAQKSHTQLDNADLTQGPANSRQWGLVAAILQYNRKANVNYCNMTADVLREIINTLREPLPLTQINLNDNKNLCAGEDGIGAVEGLLKKAPELMQLKVANTGLTEVGRARLRQAWGERPPERPPEGLVLEHAKNKSESRASFLRLGVC